MLFKSSRWITIIVAFSVVFAFGVSTLPAEVEALSSVAVTADNYCLSCHEDLYYLHDIGCWYCMSEPHRNRCVDCHEGDSSALKEDAAHVGLLKHPQENDGVKCLECHTPEESQILLAKFESNQGFDTVIHADPYVPSKHVKIGFSNTAESNSFTENLFWLTIGFLAFGIWLVLTLKR